MIYTLMHKDIELFDFEYNETLNVVTQINKIKNFLHLPLSLHSSFNTTINSNSIKQFNIWWQKRSIPDSRQNLQQALANLNVSSSVDLLAKSLGLSLTDCYWAKPMDFTKSFSEVNFFENSFSDYVGKALFDNIKSDSFDKTFFYSPDCSSDGWLSKKWIIDSTGKRILYKSGSSPYQLEPFNEVIATYIAKRLNFNYVEYKITKNKENYYSACPNMLNKDEELISAGQIMAIEKKKNDVSFYDHFINCANKLGLQNESFEKDISNMICLDYIIANTDRHFNNFGVIRDSNTLEIKRFAPIYDSGTALFNNLSINDLQKPYFLNSRNIEAKGFNKTQSKQIKTAKVLENCKEVDFSKLDDLQFQVEKVLSLNTKITAEHKELLCTILQNRKNEIMSLIRC